jgi:outer membrane protein, heavy metal efflux system
MAALPLLLAAALAIASGSGPVRAAEPALGSNVDSLLAFARERHPEFAAMRHEADAADARIASAGALPDPMFGIELRDFTNESGMNADRPNLLPARIGGARYTVTQSLPWFGKRALRREIAAAAGTVAQGQAASTWTDLAWQIKQTYAQHYLHMTNLRYGQENLGLLDQLEKITQVRYANGLAPQQDVIRAQTERTALAGELAMVEGEHAQMGERLLTLLGRPGGVHLHGPERLRPLPAVAQLEVAALEARLLERNPRLAADAARIEAAEKGRALTVRERYPDVNVGLAAMQERNRVTSYDLMFEINIPLQQDSRRAKEREAERLLDAARARQEATLNQLRAELAESLVALHTARRVEELARTSLLPQAELTLQAALAGYETGKVDFAAVLDAQRQIRRAKEDLVRARVSQEMRRADIERAIGEEL